MIISRTHSYLLLYLSGTNIIEELEAPEASQFFKRTS